MKKLLLFSVSLLLFMTTSPVLSGSQHPTSSKETQDRFVGAWRLVWLEEEAADGKIYRPDCTGLLVYTSDGHMSVQVMYRNPPASPQGNPQKQTDAATVSYAQGGYEASFGTYKIDERSHNFTFRVEGALVRALVGKDLSRVYELSGNQLIVKSSNPAEHWRVSWERF